MRAPVSRISSTRSSCRSRSSTIAVMSIGLRPNASAIARMFWPTGASRSMWPRATWPTASLRMYIGGTVSMPPGSVAASTLITPTWPRATIASCSGPIARSYCRPPAPTTVSTGRWPSMPIAMRPLSGTRSSPSRMPRQSLVERARRVAATQRAAQRERRALGHGHELGAQAAIVVGAHARRIVAARAAASRARSRHSVRLALLDDADHDERDHQQEDQPEHDLGRVIGAARVFRGRGGERGCGGERAGGRGRPAGSGFACARY